MCKATFGDVFINPPAGLRSTLVSAECPRMCSKCPVNIPQLLSISGANVPSDTSRVMRSTEMGEILEDTKAECERHGAVTSIEAAFANKTLVCLMWAFVRRKAAKLGYAPFGGVDCGAK